MKCLIIAAGNKGERLQRGDSKPLVPILGVARDIVDEACRLVEVHEVGGDPRSDLLKDIDPKRFVVP